MSPNSVMYSGSAVDSPSCQQMMVVGGGEDEDFDVSSVDAVMAPDYNDNDDWSMCSTESCIFETTDHEF